MPTPNQLAIAADKALKQIYDGKEKEVPESAIEALAQRGAIARVADEDREDREWAVTDAGRHFLNRGPDPASGKMSAAFESKVRAILAELEAECARAGVADYSLTTEINGKQVTFDVSRAPEHRATKP